MTNEKKIKIENIYRKCVEEGDIEKSYIGSTIEEDISFFKNELANAFSDSKEEYYEIWDFLDTL